MHTHVAFKHDTRSISQRESPTIHTNVANTKTNCVHHSSEPGRSIFARNRASNTFRDSFAQILSCALMCERFFVVVVDHLLESPSLHRARYIHTCSINKDHKSNGSVRLRRRRRRRRVHARACTKTHSILREHHVLHALAALHTWSQSIYSFILVVSSPRVHKARTQGAI